MAHLVGSELPSASLGSFPPVETSVDFCEPHQTREPIGSGFMTCCSSPRLVYRMGHWATVVAEMKPALCEVVAVEMFAVVALENKNGWK